VAQSSGQGSWGQGLGLGRGSFGSNRGVGFGRTQALDFESEEGTDIEFQGRHRGLSNMSFGNERNFGRSFDSYQGNAFQPRRLLRSLRSSSRQGRHTRPSSYSLQNRSMSTSSESSTTESESDFQPSSVGRQFKTGSLSRRNSFQVSDSECDSEVGGSRLQRLLPRQLSRSSSLGRRSVNFGSRYTMESDDESEMDQISSFRPSRFRGTSSNRGFQNKEALVVEKKNILRELVQDRQRDNVQARIINQLCVNRQANRNRVPLLKALVKGRNVSHKHIFEALCEDLVLDRVSDELVKEIVKDHVRNRNANDIISDLKSYQLHLPHHQQHIMHKENRRTDNMLEKLAMTITHPRAVSRIAKTGIVQDLIEELASGRRIGQRSRGNAMRF